MLGQIDGHRMSIRANHDHVDIFAEHAAEVGDGLAAAEANVLAEKERIAAQMDHRRLEAHPRPQRRLLEKQRHHAAWQERFAKAAFVLRLQVLRDREDALDFGGRQVGQGQQVSHDGFLQRTAHGACLLLCPGLCLDDLGEDVAALVGLVVA